MERYQTYMDGIAMPEALQERLLHLEKPPVPKQTWKRYSALAAAIILVACISVLGTRGIHPKRPNEIPVPPVATATPGQPESTSAPEPTAVPEATEGLPGMTIPDPNPMPNPDNGYTVYQDGNAIFYDLPNLLFSSSVASDGASNYVLSTPEGTERQLDRADVVSLAGGESGLQDHLLWSGLVFGGELYFNQNGAFHALVFSGTSTDWSVSLEMLEGREVPDCVAVSPDTVSAWQGTTIAGQAVEEYSDGSISYCGRRVSFEFGGYGYKFTGYALSSRSAESLCARFVRHVIAGGFHPELLDAVSSGANRAPTTPDDLGGIVLPTSDPAIPDKGTPPSDAPVGNIIQPGEDGYVDPAAEPSPELPDRGVPPSDMPTTHIIHPGEEEYVEPFPPPPAPSVDGEGSAGPAAEPSPEPTPPPPGLDPGPG